ncbi:arginyltransferase [Panacagrimonas sp.]|uniref:arginyltransferase n=1 Tax=Panacagrimonas sp. TaxID=2480088 RepID=UPI003B52C5D7
MNERVRLFLSTEHPCGYLPARSARSLFVDPDYRVNPTRYQSLLEQGFRRGGNHVYRPRCESCRACVPARIPVADFIPNRAQRRCQKRNNDLRVRICSDITDHQFDLYQRYLRARHDDGGMNPEDKSGFHNFLNCGWGATEFWEFLHDEQLLACAVVDRVPQALSAVYTFFAPEYADRGLGTYAVLAQLQAAREQGLQHVYLGYWVPGSPKMDYKRNFRPMEVLGSNGWERADISG